MKRIKILKNGIEKYKCEKPTTEADAWLVKHLEKHTFGKPAVYESIFNEETGEIEQILVTPAEEFEILEEDITNEIEQAIINELSLKFLFNTDFMILRHIGQKSLEMETSMTNEEYIELEMQRQIARNSIIK